MTRWTTHCHMSPPSRATMPPPKTGHVHSLPELPLPGTTFSACRFFKFPLRTFTIISIRGVSQGLLSRLVTPLFSTSRSLPPELQAKLTLRGRQLSKLTVRQVTGRSGQERVKLQEPNPNEIVLPRMSKPQRNFGASPTFAVLPERAPCPTSHFLLPRPIPSHNLTKSTGHVCALWDRATIMSNAEKLTEDKTPL